MHTYKHTQKGWKNIYQSEIRNIFKSLCLHFLQFLQQKYIIFEINYFFLNTPTPKPKTMLWQRLLFTLISTLLWQKDPPVYCKFVLKKKKSLLPWLVRLSGLGIVPQSERSLVRFPVRACLGCGPHPQLGCIRGNQSRLLSHTDVSLPPFLSKNIHK